MKYFFITIVAISFGYYLGGHYYSDFNYEWMDSANSVKLNLLKEYEMMDDIIQNTLFDANNADKGIYDDLVDEMAERGYFGHRQHLIELLANEE